MKITIDTKEDSHEDIRKLIRMLRSLIGETVGETEIETIRQPSPEGNELNNLMSLFDNESLNGESVNENETKIHDAENKKEENDLGVTFY